MILLNRCDAAAGVEVVYKPGSSSSEAVAAPVPLMPWLVHEPVRLGDGVRVIDLLELTRSTPWLAQALRSHDVPEILAHFPDFKGLSLEQRDFLERAQAYLAKEGREAEPVAAVLWLTDLLDLSGLAGGLSSRRLLDVGAQVKPTGSNRHGFARDDKAWTYSISFLPMDDLLLVPVKLRMVVQTSGDAEIISESCMTLWEALSGFWAEMSVDESSR